MLSRKGGQEVENVPICYFSSTVTKLKEIDIYFHSVSEDLDHSCLVLCACAKCPGGRGVQWRTAGHSWLTVK